MNILSMQKALKRARSEGGFCTLLGVGPMSPMVLQAALEISSEQDFPILFIASRNQVDKDEFGGGYVNGWDQLRFAQAIRDMADKISYRGQYYLCRDHGGPWQRDEERRARMPEKEAMERGLRSYYADIDAGFDLLHIDPTKEPGPPEGAVPMDRVLRRTVELIARTEAYRRAQGKPPIGYEVGTEETNGGLTGAEAFEAFIRRLRTTLAEKGLPMPGFIVGQTGTLTRLTENVGHYSFENAIRLSRLSAENGMELKQHNTDYLPEELLLAHPAMGVSSANVAPEFGTVETRAYLLLDKVEKRLYELGLVGEATGLTPALQRAAVNTGRWRKWMVDGKDRLTCEEVLSDAELTRVVTDVAGHYTFETPEIAPVIRQLLDNLEKAQVPARRYVVDKIKEAIGRYVTCYNLRGLTSRLEKYQ